MNTLLLATAAEPGALDLILPAPAELVYGAIAFLAVFLVIKAKAFPALDKALDARSDAIQGKMEASERALQEAEEAKRGYESNIQNAQGEANRIIDEAKQTAEALRRDIVAKAESEAQTIVARAQQDAAAERDRNLQELRGKVGTLSVELASKIVEKELDASAHQGLVDQYINRLASSN